MINVSIVLYNPDFKKLVETLNCVLQIKNLNKIYIIDNSENDKVSKYILSLSDIIIYKHSGSNLGFGKAHNIALKESYNSSVKLHLIVNPDIFFEGAIVDKIAIYLKENKDVALLMPKILNYNYSIQFLPKLLPSPLSILSRSLSKKVSLFEKSLHKYELRFVDKDTIYQTPVISGCFQVLNISALRGQELFDESFFMYFEDWDLSRRLSVQYKTIYFPLVSVLHHYESGANKSLKLFFVFLRSAILYFNKWGWFFDEYRKNKNIEVLSQF